MSVLQIFLEEEILTIFFPFACEDINITKYFEVTIGPEFLESVFGSKSIPSVCLLFILGAGGDKTGRLALL